MGEAPHVILVYLLSENSLIIPKRIPLDADLFRVYTQRLILQNTKCTMPDVLFTRG